ncbi:tRNA uridine-5-carboxymethylaminomethyl(34) synthesis GTPase MnmE [Tichowtungia aerotolerans]|uniref:tRNA modification GTPase MnmE n=1 Tax=Tichowtungia aerotolerans TaxID=2697043 RepID=A0A6P1M6G5_9BACT|nr:tRNA uridine-5-carboxymethylaminomethyl(34) synthesis GTPase MnmE [Tichowtungia aerotolerans]QHI70170.1 tRNA uridine-5-carboxymethylaminomethyl(34) synthesis GTPase MnmE [Tichowtungia aerotolerans]
MNENETIAAIATPPGEGGVGIVRISGSKVWKIADQIFQGLEKPSQKEGGTFIFGKILGAEGEEIDEGLCLIFRAPRSYTGDDTVEIQGHGGSVVLRKILRRALEAGARMAEPGEFTKRAFLNGKMDLVQAEAVADLIHARSDRAAAAALEQLEGSLSGRFNRLYDQCVDIAADLETTLDFIEDELPDEVFPTLGKKLDGSFQTLEDLLLTWDEGRLLREGARVVIMGRPNAGKSTLFNALLGHDRAIVTSIAGTTRDVIEEGIVLGGIPLRILDTAGLREAECEIEREGIRRAREHAGAADIAVYLIDCSRPFSVEDAEHLEKLKPEQTVVVLNKNDVRSPAFNFQLSMFQPLEASLGLGDGLDDIRSALAARLGGFSHAPAHAVISERHRNLLELARVELENARGQLTGLEDEGVVLAAEHLRSALEFLGQVTGRIYHNELLDNVFSRFCIGK